MDRKIENQYSQEYFNRVPDMNQNDINDDDLPCPPPGLDRLVTGQTVSFDDGLNTPTFDRIVPGEGMSPVAARVPFAMHNKSFFNDTSPQDFFDSYLHNANVHEDPETANQPSRNKYPNQMFPSSNTDRRETFLQQDLPHMPSPSNAFSQVDSKNTNTSFYNNYQTPSLFSQPISRPMGNVQYNNSQSQRPTIVSKPDPNVNNFVTPENDQNIGIREKTSVPDNFANEMELKNDEIPTNRMAVEGSCDDAYTKIVQSNQTFSNYGPDQRDSYSQQDTRRIPLAVFDQVDSKSTTNVSSSYQPLTNMESFPVQFTTQLHSVAAKSEIPNYSTAGNAQIAGNKEKVIGISKEMEPKNEDLPSNRMAVEGSCSNVSFTRPVLSYSPNRSPNYEHWYSNNSKNSFPDNSQNEDSRQMRDNVYGSSKSSISLQTMQQQVQTSPNEAHFGSQAGTTGLNVPEVQTMHSKTPSSLSNASSTNNELSSYQHNDNFSTDSKRDHSSNVDQGEGRGASNAYDMRANSSVIDEETTSYSDYEDRSIEMRTVIGYNNNTIPRHKNEKLTAERKSNNSRNPHKTRKPPLEQRMVVGETSSDAPPPSQRTNRTRDDYDSRLRRSKTDQFEERSDKLVKKQLYSDRKDRRKIESEEEYDDDDDDDESEYKNYEDNRDRFRESPKMFQKGSRRKPADRGQMKESSYYYDSYPRSYVSSTNSKYRKPVNNRRYDDPFFALSRNSRPSSRSQIKYPDVYEPLNPYRLVHENKVDERELRKLLEMWETDLPRYVLWFRNTFEKDYSIWYRRYYEPRLRSLNNVHQTDRRGSGHSDRNSAINDAFSDNEERSMVGISDGSLFRPVESETSILRESRYTPMKYQGPHTKGVFNSLGQLIVVKGHHPKHNRSAQVEIYRLLPPDEADWREFLKYPGPFVVGETRPNTVCDLLTKRMEESCTSSEKLLYLLIKLIIRGVSDGTAISEILTGSYEREYGAQLIPEETEVKQTSDSLSHSKILDKYTNLLLQGSQDSALDWAVEHELWGHAIFLASKIITSRYREVLSKFEANVSGNNPLKTLYQLYLDEIPQSTSACRDEKWGDWRPHLAMILSNRAPDNEQHKAAIIMLGDSLACKDIFAAHFCYVAAELVFNIADKSSAKYSLLSSRNNVSQFDTNMPNNAILLTQMYEYAKRLQHKEFTVSALLPYKYLLATRLFSYGKIEPALQYLESLAIDIMKESSDQFVELSHNVLELAERFAYSDSKSYGSNLMRKSWLKDLKQFVYKKCNKPFDLHTDNEGPDGELNFQSQSLLTVPQKQSTVTSPVEMPSPQSFSLMFPASNVNPQPNLLTMPLPGSNQQWQGNAFASAPSITTPSFPKPAQQPPIMNPNEPTVADGQNNALQQTNAYGQEDYFNPWNLPQQPISISMHSSNNYFNEGAKSEKTKDENDVSRLLMTADRHSSEKQNKNERKLEVELSHSNTATRRRWRTVESLSFEGDNYATSYYGSLCNSKIVFNGTFPIDKPFGVRKQSSGEMKNSPNRSQSNENQSSSMATTTAGEELKAEDANDEKKSHGNNSWFNGIVAKFKRTNVTVAKLPDDKEIRFKYDYNKQQWVDKDKKDEESSAIREPPPPKASFRKYQPNDNEQQPNEQQSSRDNKIMTRPQAVSSGSQSEPSGPQIMPPGSQSLSSFGDQTRGSGPPISNSSNIYTLSRGRGMKANYVNVLSNNKFTNNMPPVAPNSVMNHFPDP